MMALKLTSRIAILLGSVIISSALSLSVDTTTAVNRSTTATATATATSSASITPLSRREFAPSLLAKITTTTAASSIILPNEPCSAIPPKTEEIQRIYDSQASTYESLYSDSIISRKLDFVTLRQNLLSKATGDVLELGVGTGLNLPHYPILGKNSNHDPITSYTAVDISPNMLELAKLRFENSVDGSNSRPVSQSLQDLYNQNKVSFQVADVESLTSIFKYDDDSGDLKTFDTIIDTFGLCVFPNPVEALTQARELLSSGGQLLLLEHQDSTVAKVLSPTRSLSEVSKSCRYDDDVRGLVRAAGFSDADFQDLAGGFLVSVTAIK